MLLGIASRVIHRCIGCLCRTFSDFEVDEALCVVHLWRLSNLSFGSSAGSEIINVDK